MPGRPASGSPFQVGINMPKKKRFYIRKSVIKRLKDEENTAKVVENKPEEKGK
jgi:hypothetical protein